MSGFVRMSRELMDLKWDEYQSWHWNGDGPRNLEFERWHAEDSEIDERAQEAVRLAFTIDVEPLRNFDFRESDVRGFLRDMSFRFQRRDDKRLLVEREREIQLELSHMTDPHQFAWDGVWVEREDRRPPMRYCSFDGCGLEQDEHPRYSVSRQAARLRLVQDRLVELGRLEQAAA